MVDIYGLGRYSVDLPIVSIVAVLASRTELNHL